MGVKVANFGVELLDGDRDGNDSWRPPSTGEIVGLGLAMSLSFPRESRGCAERMRDKCKMKVTEKNLKKHRNGRPTHPHPHKPIKRAQRHSDK
jgi:hypothetical protein